MKKRWRLGVVGRSEPGDRVPPVPKIDIKKEIPTCRDGDATEVKAGIVETGQRPPADAYIAMAHIVVAYIVIPYMVMAYTVMACIVMDYTVMAYIAMAFIGMAYMAMPPKSRPAPRKKKRAPTDGSEGQNYF